MNDREYLVTHRLPSNDEEVLCYGYKTYCCKEDMDETPDWHEVTFRFKVGSYKLKKEVPEDVEESILECYEVHEAWDCGDYSIDGRVIGVSKWKKKPKKEIEDATT